MTECSDTARCIRKCHAMSEFDISYERSHFRPNLIQQERQGAESSPSYRCCTRFSPGRNRQCQTTCRPATGQYWRSAGRQTPPRGPSSTKFCRSCAKCWTPFARNPRRCSKALIWAMREQAVKRQAVLSSPPKKEVLQHAERHLHALHTAVLRPQAALDHLLREADCTIGFQPCARQLRHSAKS